MQSNTYSKIFDIVNNYTQVFDDERARVMLSKYGKGYSNKKNYIQGENLEFGLVYDGLATQKSYTNYFHPQYQWYPHDTIFNDFPDVLIDWKRINDKTGNVSISSLKNKEKQFELGQVTHYGFWSCEFDKENFSYRYNCYNIKPFRTVMDNLFNRNETYALYRP